jgi:hypothetical protein
MLLSHHQNAGQNWDIEIANSSLEIVTVQIFGNNTNKSKFDSGVNYEETEFLKCLCTNGYEHIEIRPEKWRTNDWLFHHDNVRPHTAYIVQEFLAKNKKNSCSPPTVLARLSSMRLFSIPQVEGAKI